MGSITEYLNKIITAVKGVDTRQAMHDAIKQVYDDAATSGNANMEVTFARGTENTLNDRLTKMDEVDQTNTALLATTFSQLISKANQQELDALRNELANIIAAAGDGTIPTELLDMRTIKDVTFTSAGKAINTLAENNIFKIALYENGVTKSGSTTSTLSFTPIAKDGITTAINMLAEIKDTNFIYSYHRIPGTYQEVLAKGEKIYVLFQSEQEVDFTLVVTNGNAWGSEDNTTATIEKVRISLNEENSRVQFVELNIASSLYQDFFANPIRVNHQNMRLLIEFNQSFRTAVGTYSFNFFAYQDRGLVLNNRTVLDKPLKAFYADKSKVAEKSLDTEVLSKQLTIPKVVISGVGFVSGNSANTGNTLSVIKNNNIVGYTLRVDRAEGNTSYVYSYNALDRPLLYQDMKERKYRLVMEFDVENSTMETLVLSVRIAGLSSWANGSVVYPITFSKTLGYKRTMDIDFSSSEIAAFFAKPEVTEQSEVFVMLANEGSIAVAGHFEIKVYFLDITDLSDMSASEFTEDRVVFLDAFQPKEEEENQNEIEEIVALGDSLTAQAGWTSTLESLSRIPVFNAGTGGENVRTIAARQGADVMQINNITIPADVTPVTLATYGGIPTQLGYKATPLLQGGTSHVNPCKLGDIEGTLAWTGSSYSDTSGTWTFTRKTAGQEIALTRPTALRTNLDINHNKGILILFMGQNGGYKDLDDLVNMHKLVLAHSQAKHKVVLGLSSGDATSREEYETAMRKEFGRYFISLREYLSKYVLEDAGLVPTQADLDAMAIGKVPPQALSDSVHYTTATKTVIGNMLYKKMVELNIL